MKVLVTGAAGFIGGQLWHTLWKRGDEVVGIDNFSYGNLDNLKFDDHDFGPEVRRMDIRDREALPKLFEEMFPHAGELRGDGRRSMGIGLSVCMSIVRAHGGTMKAENRATGGACVSFVLPMEEE